MLLGGKGTMLAQSNKVIYIEFSKLQTELTKLMGTKANKLLVHTCHPLPVHADQSPISLTQTHYISYKRLLTTHTHIVNLLQSITSNFAISQYFWGTG